MSETESGDTREYKTMRVPEDAWEKARASKENGETWGDYLLRCADADPFENTELTEADVRAIAESVVEENVVDEALR